MRILLGVLVSAAALILPNGNVRAASDATCAAYVAEAMKEVEAAQKEGCDFDFANDPMWSTDVMVHKRWCHDADEGAVEDQTDHMNLWGLYTSPRSKLLTACSFCVGYTQRAMGQIAEANRLHCTFPPGESARWDPNHKDHYYWCMGLKGMGDGGDDFMTVLYYSLNPESDARDDELKQCRGKFFGDKLGNRDALHVPPKKLGTAKTKKIGRVRDPTYDINSEGSGKSGSGGSTPPPCGGLGQPPCPPGTPGSGRSSSSKVLGPGLLEGGGGASSNAPSARGTPVAPSVSGSGSGGLRGSTYSH
jgi:hypothetical protein